MTLDFGKMVRDAREAKGWSQEQLAEHVGTTQSTVDRIENNQTRRSRYMHDIITALGLVRYAADGHAPAKTAKYTGNIRSVTYTLPSELIDRIHSYKIDYDILSDDEAAKQLIEEGLMHYDHFYSITDRLYAKFKERKSLKDAARQVLGNHPLVKSIEYGVDKVKFSLQDHFTVEMDNRGIATVWDMFGDLYEHSIDRVPDWAALANIDSPSPPPED